MRSSTLKTLNNKDLTSGEVGNGYHISLNRFYKLQNVNYFKTTFANKGRVPSTIQPHSIIQLWNQLIVFYQIRINFRP